MKKADFNLTLCNKVAQMSVKLLGQNGFVNKVHNELRKEYDNYLDIYNTVKPVLTKYANDCDIVPNNDIEKVLSENKYSKEIIWKVSQIIENKRKEKNSKQQTYLTIISTYGREKGLKIYTHIKKYLGNSQVAL